MTRIVTSPLDMLAYVMAGDARFTLTGKQGSFGYRVNRPKDFDPVRPIYFVSALRPDTSESYFGNLKTYGKADPAAWTFEVGRKSKLTSDDDAIIVYAFAWFWRNLVKAQGLEPHRLDQVKFRAHTEAPVGDLNDDLDDVLPL